MTYNCSNIDGNGDLPGRNCGTWGDGAIYEGYWKNDLKNGQGTMFSEGFTFSGNWKNDTLNDKNAIIVYDEPGGYKGSVKKNISSGYGEETWVSPDNIVIYKGNFRNNQWNGFGKRITTDCRNCDLSCREGTGGKNDEYGACCPAKVDEKPEKCSIQGLFLNGLEVLPFKWSKNYNRHDPGSILFEYSNGLSNLWTALGG